MYMLIVWTLESGHMCKKHHRLLWLRCWDNRGKCHMDEKRIQSFNACQTHTHCSMYPSIFNRFPVIQPVSSKVRHFSTFWPPWNAPGTIAVNVIHAWKEDRFNAGQMRRSIYPYLQPFKSYSEILIGNCNFFLPPNCI